MCSAVSMGLKVTLKTSIEQTWRGGFKMQFVWAKQNVRFEEKC